ncbi:MAG TPA: hypothetical protein PLW14_13240 [Chlorobiota bacterium]|nr:hypothetical protein [Chlorobiota bacterium]
MDYIWRYRFGPLHEREQKRQYANANGTLNNGLLWTYTLLGADAKQLMTYNGLQADWCGQPAGTVWIWPVEHNSYGPAQSRIIMRPDGTRNVVITDHLGSTRLTLSTDAAPMQSQLHNAFGEVTSDVGEVHGGGAYGATPVPIAFMQNAGRIWCRVSALIAVTFICTMTASSQSVKFSMSCTRLRVHMADKVLTAHSLRWDGRMLVVVDTNQNITGVILRDTLATFFGRAHVYLGNLVIHNVTGKDGDSVTACSYELPTLRAIRCVRGESFVKFGHVLSHGPDGLGVTATDVVTGESYTVGTTELYAMYRWIAEYSPGCIRDLVNDRNIECGDHAIYLDASGYGVLAGYGGPDSSRLEIARRDTDTRIYVLDTNSKNIQFVGTYAFPRISGCLFAIRGDSAYMVGERTGVTSAWCSVRDPWYKYHFMTESGYDWYYKFSDANVLRAPDGSVVRLWNYADVAGKRMGTASMPCEIYHRLILIPSGPDRESILHHKEDGTVEISD